jgi:glucan 1,3-beta-glucosidase
MIMRNKTKECQKRRSEYVSRPSFCNDNRTDHFPGIIAGVIVLILAIVIPVAIVVSNKNSNKSVTTTSSGGSNTNTAVSGVPASVKNTQMDPGVWLDLKDFNTTYTNETVGGLPIIGLNTSWDDSTQANERTPALNTAWGSYATTPARGVNLGGWLALEPFITPSLFNYDSKMGIIDEWTLTKYLGTSGSLSTLEKHYSTFVTEQTFIDIASAGLDHVRIPFSYWAVVTYDGDPYVFRTSWRYLLRAIEWARKHGLRINLDLHGVPGSQNGWNHSGRLGSIGWLNGTDGTLNAQRSLQVHDSLSKFFAQDRYKNIIAFYGLANEPKMTALTATTVNDWTASAYKTVRANGITAYIVFGDGFLGLANWKGQLQDYPGLVLDVHQYVIFNVAQIVFNHTAKINYACVGWTEQAQQSMSTSTGFGPTMFAEWSQADTDCAQNLNNVGVGNRWTGTYNTGNSLSQVLTPTCPTTNCDCTNANADPSTYSSAYKKFLLMFAEAQMHSFEKGWGWFYWTWKTESAAQWSYQAGLAAGVLPAKAYAPSFYCNTTIPTFSDLAENY